MQFIYNLHNNDNAYIFLFVEHFMNEIFQLSAMKKYHIQFPYMLKNKTFENYYTKKPSWRKKKNEP